MIHEAQSVIARFPNPDVRDAYHIGVDKGWRSVNETSTEEIIEVLAQEQYEEDREYDSDGAVRYVFLCWENYIQYSPWEMTASEFNRHELREELWAALEEGLSDGARYAYWESMCGGKVAV